MLVESPFNSWLSHRGDGLVLEESYGVILQPHVWANDDITVMMYHVFELWVHRILL